MQEIKEETLPEDKMTWHEKHKQSMSFGDRIADGVANNMGSWKFIIIQTITDLFHIYSLAISFFQRRIY